MKNNRLLQGAHELIAELSVYDAFVAMFVAEDYQPGNWQNENEKNKAQKY